MRTLSSTAEKDSLCFCDILKNKLERYRQKYRWWGALPLQILEIKNGNVKEFIGKIITVIKGKDNNYNSNDFEWFSKAIIPFYNNVIYDSYIQYNSEQKNYNDSELKNDIKELYEIIIDFINNWLKKYDEDYFKNWGKIDLGIIKINAFSELSTMRDYLKGIKDGDFRMIEFYSKMKGRAGCLFPSFLDPLGQALAKRNQKDLYRINKNFVNEMQKHISNEYVKKFLDIKDGEYETFFEGLIQLIKTGEETNEQTDIIEFHRIISNIIENIQNERDWEYVSELPNSFDGGLAGLHNSYWGKLWLYKYTIAGKISKLVAKLENEINTHRANKSIEFDITNIKNEFYEKMKRLKDGGSTVKFDMVASSSIPNVNTKSPDITNDIKKWIVDINNIVSNFGDRYGKIFKIPEENPDKYKSDLINYIELFANTYNQIVDKINNIHGNYNINDNLIQILKELHGNVVNSIGNYLWYVRQINNFKYNFINKETGNFERISIPNNLSINTKRIKDRISAIVYFILCTFKSKK